MIMYCRNNIFSKPDDPADIVKVEKCFGATKPGGIFEKIAN